MFREGVVGVRYAFIVEDVCDRLGLLRVRVVYR